jgi:hypothetical protein
MLVDIQCEGDRRVPEAAGDDARVDAGAQSHTRIGVAQAMQRDLWQASTAAQLLERHADPPGCQRTAILSDKHEAAVCPGSAAAKTLLRL